MHNGYYAYVDVEIMIDDLTSLPKTLSLAEIKGVSALTGLTFDVRDRKKAETEAFSEAIADAKIKAYAAATAMGTATATIKRIQEKNVYFTDPFFLNVTASPYGLGRIGGALMAESDFRGSGRKTPIVTPGTVDIYADVVILAELK